MKENIKSPITAIQETFKTKGLFGLYRFWKFDIPIALFSRGLLIGLYESKYKRAFYHSNGNVPHFMRFLDAYALALFTGFISYPFEHAKQRLMRAIAEKPNEDIMFEMIARMEGSRVFLKGISNLFLTQISTALALTMFYTCLDYRTMNQVPI
jgi:hypothetical protein